MAVVPTVVYHSLQVEHAGVVSVFAQCVGYLVIVGGGVGKQFVYCVVHGIF